MTPDLTLFFRPEARGQLTLLTGPVGSGKTTLCTQLLAAAEHHNADVAGVYCPAVMQGKRKVGMDICLLPEKTCQRLGVERAQWQVQSLTPRWQMNEAALAWANAHLQALAATDLLIIDELGPLEFLGNQGLTAAFPLLDARDYRQAVVVIRPDLLEQAQARWPWARVMALPVMESRA